MATKKFSQFTNGSQLQVNDEVVGLRLGVNYRFSFPSDGFKDSSGNYLLKYVSVGAQAVNYPQITNASLFTKVTYSAEGSSSNIDVSIEPKGAANLILDGLKWPQADGLAGQVLSTDGLTQLFWSTPAGFPSVGAAGTILRSDGSNWVASISTFADTYASNTLLYSNGSNTVQSLSTSNSAVLLTNSSGVPSFSSSMTNGQILIGSTGASPVLSTITAGTGISVSNSSGSITISGSGGGYGWTEVIGTSQLMSVNNGYISNNAALVTLTLPVTASIGDTFIIQGKGAGLFRIAQNAGQTINFGSSPTTTGAAGSLTSTNQFDSIEILCITANTDWAVLTGPQGTFTVV